MAKTIADHLITSAPPGSTDDWHEIIWRQCIPWRGRWLLKLGLVHRFERFQFQAEYDFVSTFSQSQSMNDVYDDLHAYRNHPWRSTVLGPLLGLAIDPARVRALAQQLLGGSPPPTPVPPKANAGQSFSRTL